MRSMVLGNYDHMLKFKKSNTSATTTTSLFGSMKRNADAKGGLGVGGRALDQSKLIPSATDEAKFGTSSGSASSTAFPFP
ncbi:unnamed protein product, partial [Amoebophrya sp. A25]|eukprot:GSA25T00018905001.1